MQHTKISWVKNPDSSRPGWSSNPVKGDCPVGCSYCYVKPLRRRFGWHTAILPYMEELDVIYKRKKPAGIFIGSAMELFHDKTIQYMPEIMETVRACPQHRFYFLTKCPENLAKFSPFPDNCYVGVTVTRQEYLGDAINSLASIEAKVRYLSIEPMLSRILTTPGELQRRNINQIIIGPQTTPPVMPEIDWVREIVEACDKAEVRVFLKDNLIPIMPENTYKSPFHFGIHGLRQEVP